MHAVIKVDLVCRFMFNFFVIAPTFRFIDGVVPDVGVSVLNCDSGIASVQECTQLSLGSCSNRRLLALSCADNVPIGK